MLGKALQPEIEELIEARDLDTLRDTLQALETADIAEILDDLPVSSRAVVYRLLPHDQASDVFEHFSFEGQEELIRDLSNDELKRLLNDMETTNRWFFVVMMGRSAGHLALGAGKAAGAPITLIPEEFPNAPIAIDDVVRTLEGAIVKRLAQGRPDRVAVIAEGLVPQMRWGTPEDVGLAVESVLRGHFPYSTGNIIEVDGGFHLRKL